MQKDLKFSKICLVYFISLFMFVAVRIATALGAFDFLNDYLGDALFTFIVQFVIMGILPLTLFILFYKKEKFSATTIKNTFSEIGFKKIRVKTIILSIILGICAYIFNIVIASFFDAIIASFGYSGVGFGSSSGNGGIWYLFFSLFFTAVMPGIFEEIMHRGILLNGVKESKNYKWAILVSGLFFGLMHLNINQFFYASIIGCFFAFIVIISKSIWPAIIMHFINNAINVYFSWASKNKSFGYDFYSNLNNFLKEGNYVIVVVSVLSFMILLSLLTILIIVMIYNDNNKDRKIYLRLFTEKHLNNFIQTKQPLLNRDDAITNSGLICAEDINIPTQEEIESLFNINSEKIAKFEYKYNIFFFATLLLGLLVTIFTLIWGIL